jgi:hypothetical protein
MACRYADGIKANGQKNSRLLKIATEFAGRSTTIDEGTVIATSLGAN